eukprot:TRINITY_DN7994_c0_g3_i1.p1 TRINITY_DN7994_c0_g3~~TRINITY_DN7994_c0_g3_i1.p1  ORF type:complete len:391 (-),score=128.40 TRINITY_DN7994_c0_g3_i1:211-1383(-)
MLEAILQNNELTPLAFIADEIEFMQRVVDSENESKAIVDRLTFAMEIEDKDMIVDTLNEAKVSRIQLDPSLFKQVMEELKKLSELGCYKDTARKTKRFKHIQLAIEKAKEHNTADPDIVKLGQLQEQLKELRNEAIVALNVLEKPLMERVLEKARELEVSNELIAAIQMLLYDMDEYCLEELQFKFALRLNDKKLLLKRLIAKKKREASGDAFSFERCPVLQDPESWAKKSFFKNLFGAEKRRLCFLQWTPENIHKPLSKNLSKEQKKQALDLFNNLLYYMQDKAHETPTDCAQYVIYTGIHNPALRDEIYLQIMKQLNLNSKAESARKGWTLLMCCLRAFPPSATQNYLVNFICNRAKDKDQLLTAMYSKMMFGQGEILQINDIRSMIR